MTPDDCVEELAPAVVVRAALFPVRTLLGLRDSELAALSTEVGTRPTPAFEQAYLAGVERQRRALLEATVGDPRFARALCLTNDALSRWITTRSPQTAPREAPRDKRARRLDATLYRYLARAVWRTQPCDLWAGVTVAGWGDATRVRAEPARHAIAPDLRPYQCIVQSLAHTGSYVDRGTYKLNPTLTLDEERNRWRYTVRIFSSIASMERGRSPGIDALLRTLAQLRPAPLSVTAAELRERGFRDPELHDMLKALTRAGLLVGGLAFPRAFDSAWDALTAVPASLDEQHAPPWRSAVLRLRRICRRLEGEMGTIPLGRLHHALDEARAVPRELAAELDVPTPPMPRSVLRCDTSTPFSIVLGPEEKARLNTAVTEFDLFERRHGVTAAARAAHRTLVVTGRGGTPRDSAAGDGHVWTQESAWRAAGSDHEVGRRLLRWSAWLSGAAFPRTHEPEGSAEEMPPPPIGGLIVRPAGGSYRIMGSTSEIAAAYGRFGHLWYGIGNSGRLRFDQHPLHEWYHRTLTRAAGEADLEIVEYVGPCEAMPNMLARPRFPFRQWDRWGTLSSYRTDQIGAGPATDGAPVVLATARGRSRPMAICCFSPANVGYSEPRLEALLLSSFRDMPDWFAPELPMEAELVQSAPSPALLLPSGNSVKPRRTVLHGTTLAELVAARRPQRFLLWQDLARRHDWPELVLVSRDVGSPLPVVRDSPLAVEAVLRGLSDRTGFLCVEEPGEQAQLSTDEGEAFTVEFIVPFLRRRHAWSRLASGQPGAPRRPHAGRRPDARHL
ncbi:lantibiotic dehydratase [Streptomyces sp. NPDC004838]